MVEGQVFMERPPDGPPKPVTMGADGIALAADGRRLYYCPLLSRRLYSAPADALTDRSLTDAQVAEAVVDRGTRAARPTAWRPTTPDAST